MKTMRIKKGDSVMVIAGSHKGKTGKVLETQPRKDRVVIEGIGKIKRHIKPTQLNPQGGTKEIQKGLPVSNVALIDINNKPTRIKFGTNKAGNKVRVANTTKKEIK